MHYLRDKIVAGTYTGLVAWVYSLEQENKKVGWRRHLAAMA
jgi:hypothetical protein